MVIDTSALVAIALEEPPQQRLLNAIEGSTKRTISAVSVLEAGIVLQSRLGKVGIPAVFDLISKLKGDVIQFDQLQANAALVAFGRFGKGMGHRAQLNF